MQVFAFVSVTLALAVGVQGHGRLTIPAGRATCWRYGFKQCVPNYDDDGMNCGGYGTQWEKNDGKCGVCGDPWDGERKHEAGGKYAPGIVTRSYRQGQKINVEIEITTNHGGWHEFRLCKNDDFSKPVTQECLDQHLLKFEDGSTRWTIHRGNKKFSRTLQLPAGLTCSQCLLQWKWHCANNWDCDKDGKCCIGCGPQEEFYGCADIEIK